MNKSTDFTNDEGKYIQAKVIALSEQLHKLPQMCDKVPLETGMGKTANFTKFNRTDVPVDKLSEGVTPQETTFTISTQSVTVDQWGLYMALSDVSMVTTKHPVFQRAMNLLADAVARCVDYNVAEVLNAGTNTQFWDGSRADRSAITATDRFEKAVAMKAFTDLGDKGVPERGGDYIAICGPQVLGDILNEAATVGSLTAAKQSSNDQAPLEKGLVTNWAGFRWVKSNFLPKFNRTSTFSAPTAGAGGSLSGTVYHKVTRRNLARGFEEDIQAEANTAMGANNRLTFTAPAASGFVYRIYAGSATGDANLYLAKDNLAAGQTYNLDTLPTSGANPPTTPAASVTVHPIYVFGAEAVDMVEMNELAAMGMITPPGPSDSDPLKQRRKMGSKWMHKSGIRDQDRMKRIELASAF